MQRYLPPAIFVIVGLIGLGIVSVVYRIESKATMARFEIVADDVANRLRNRLDQHIALLRATEAFFAANSNDVSQPAFARFMTELNLSTRFGGLQGIGFARLLPVGEEARAEAEILANYAIERTVWPETDADMRSVIVLLEPFEERNATALGYDMFSEPNRREAMLGAIATDVIRASAPVELVQEITSDKQVGFLVYLPLAATQPTEPQMPALAGFVYAPFRAADLHEAVFREWQAPVVLETRDTTDDGNAPLYQSPGFQARSETARYTVTRTIVVGGRQWTMQLHETSDFGRVNDNFNTFVVTLICLLLAAATAFALRWHMTSIKNARELQAMSDQRMIEKDLLLQEMKHRIKNSIARILAISRQTAAASDSIETFATSFSARLQAMADAQDLLTGSASERADLKVLVTREIDQLAAQGSGNQTVSGPSVLLDERATQALGLTFHELATNALKYGACAGDDGALSVTWRVTGSGGNRRLHLVWKETGINCNGSGGQGFGTRLIDANIKGELGGSIERRFAAGSLTIELAVPLQGRR